MHGSAPTPAPGADGLLPPEFLADLAADRPSAVRRWTTPVGENVFRLPPFDPTWCATFLERYDARIAALEARGRGPQPPNSMHDGGAALDALGWEHMFDGALTDWLRPIATELYPEVGGDTLDEVYGFVTDYGPDGDAMLGYHADDAEVTLNLCLGGSFEGSELYFRGRRCADHRQTPWSAAEEFEYRHEPGVAILHAGDHRHGVHWIDAGRRRNLILWLRSSDYRDRNAAADNPCPTWCQRSRGV